jgi:hypothetical protein
VKRIITIRYAALALILAGFFLPWLDTGEARAARVILSGLELAVGQDGYPSIEASPELFAVLFLGLLVTVNNKPKHTLLVLFLSICLIVFCSPSGTDHVLKAGLLNYHSGEENWGSAKYNFWDFGKVSTVIGFITLLATSFLKQYRDPFLDFKSTKFIVVTSWVIIAHLILLSIFLGGGGRPLFTAILMAAVVGALKLILIFIRFCRRSSLKNNPAPDP